MKKSPLSLINIIHAGSGALGWLVPGRLASHKIKGTLFAVFTVKENILQLQPSLYIINFI